ncbi:Hpt domain-containing protein, partial [Balneolaceae bacterium ANBcel3]|nr:Hpt domain-containing protein [Balneolaceae bacterium ANBcel3]
MKNSNYQKQVDELAEIMRVLADVWPGDREDIMVAGARLEDTMEGLQQDSGQLSKLISLAWKGLIHLYEKDEFFQSVKSATMQAINTIREYAVTNGDIQIEVFEKACDELEKAMNGESETVKSMTLTEEARTRSDVADMENNSSEETEEESAEGETEAREEEPKADQIEETPQKESTPVPVTLDDVASFIMGFDSKEAALKQYNELQDLISACLEQVEEPLKKPLKEALNILKANHPSNEDVVDIATVIGTVSKRVEKAIQLEEGEEDTNTEQGQPEEEFPSAADEVLGEVEFYMPDDMDEELMGEFITESMEQIEIAESALLDLETAPDDDELINRVFRSFHTMKGTAAFMGLTPMSEFAHSVETLLDMVRDDVTPYDSACADINLEAIDIIKNLLEGV